MTTEGANDEAREFLLRSIRDLDAEHAAGDLDDADYRALRDDYTARAAAALRAPEPLAVTDPTPGVGSRRKPWGRQAVAAGLVAVVAGLGGYAVAQSSGERLATDEATGDIAEGSVDRITKAQILTSEGKILEAVKVYDDLLADDPANPVALAQRGWLLSRVDPSLVDSGLASIERAIAADPGYPDAHFFKGMILWRAKAEPALAVEEFQRALDAQPPADVAATIEGVRKQAQAEAHGATATP